MFVARRVLSRTAGSQLFRSFARDRHVQVLRACEHHAFDRRSERLSCPPKKNAGRTPLSGSAQMARFSLATHNRLTLVTVPCFLSPLVLGVQVEVMPSGVAVVRMDVQGEKQNTFSEEFYQDMEKMVQQVEADANIKSVVLASAKPGSWIAGANIKQIEEIKSDFKRVKKGKDIKLSTVQPGDSKEERAKQAHRFKRQPSQDQVKKRFLTFKQRLTALELNMKNKDDNKSVALGTSKINYMDPRITVAWCKRNECPIDKVFARALRDKFPWACSAKTGYKF